MSDEEALVALGLRSGVSVGHSFFHTNLGDVVFMELAL